MSLHPYVVGQRYHPEVIHWPESAQYNFREGAHELVLFLNHPSPHEIRAVESGTIELRLFEDIPLIILLYRFSLEREAIPWSEAIYSWWRVPAEQRREPPRGLAANERVGLTIMLVDATTGILKAIRYRTLGPVFTALLHGAIHDQITAGDPGDDLFTDAIHALYERYPNTNSLANVANKDDGP